MPKSTGSEQVNSIAPEETAPASVEEQIYKAGNEIYAAFEKLSGLSNTTATAQAMRDRVKELLDSHAEYIAKSEESGTPDEVSLVFNTCSKCDGSGINVSTVPGHSRESADAVCEQINLIGKRVCGGRVAAEVVSGRGNYQKNPSQIGNPGVESDFRIKVVLKTLEVSPPTSEQLQQAKIVRYFLGEKRVLWSTVSQRETPEQRQEVIQMMREGIIGRPQFNEMLGEIDDSRPFGGVVEKEFINLQEDTSATHTSKLRRVGILMTALDGRFTVTDPITRVVTDARGAVLNNDDRVRQLVGRFIQQFRTPFDFESAAIKITDSVRKRYGAEKEKAYRLEIQNMVKALYGKCYEYWLQARALMTETGID